MKTHHRAFTDDSEFVEHDLSFSPIEKHDLEFLAQLYASTRWEELQKAQWNDTQRAEFLQQQFDAQHKHYQSYFPDASFLLIHKAQQAIGRIYVDRTENFICLIDIALMPDYKGQGIGTALLNELLGEAQYNQQKVTIHVEKFNPAYRWYERMGFKHIEDRGVYQCMEWYPETPLRD